MILMRMHAAIADEAEKMQTLAFRLRERFAQHFVLREFAVANRFVDAREVLINDASRAEIEMAHFTVAHLSGGQTHFFAAGTHLRPRIRRINLIVKRRAREQCGVAIFFGACATVGINAPAVADEEDYRFLWHDKMLGRIHAVFGGAVQTVRSVCRKRSAVVGCTVIAVLELEPGKVRP